MDQYVISVYFSQNIWESEIGKRRLITGDFDPTESSTRWGSLVDQIA